MVTMAGGDVITTGDPASYEIPLETLIEADPQKIVLGVNPKTIQKWKRRAFTHDAAMGPKVVRSTVLTPEEEAAKPQFHFGVGVGIVR